VFDDGRALYPLSLLSLLRLFGSIKDRIVFDDGRTPYPLSLLSLLRLFGR